MPGSVLASFESQARSLLSPQLRPQHAIEARPKALPVTAPTKSVGEGVELATLEHTRVSISAQSVRGDRASAYSLEATFTYGRIATGAAVAKEAAPASAQQLDDEVMARAPVPAESDRPAASDDGAHAVAPAGAFSFYEHVLFNATSASFSVQSRHDPLPRSTLMAVPASDLPVGINASDDMQPQAVARFSAADYAESFTKLRTRGSEQTTETVLSLKLLTREGDMVELDFRQIEILSHMRLKGVAGTGDGVRASQSAGSRERAVQMNVNGDLSTAELDAIDSLLDEVIEVANSFFSGDVRAAWDRLMSMEFSSDELTEFSLRMSVAQTRQVSRAYHGEEGLASFASRDRQSLDVLEFLAGQQRSLIESAQRHFDDASAVTLIRELLPRLLPEALFVQEQTDSTKEAAA